jgi:elongation factor P hydroxylase
MDHRVLAGRFNARLGRRVATLLVGGAREPVYLPARGGRPAMIRYTRDYARSVLHELAHWSLADEVNLAREDYGLQYQPPPRSAAAQVRFYEAEVPVQALELLMSRVCGVSFQFSADNPGADGGAARQMFEHRVRCGSQRLLREGLAPRSAAVLDALSPDWRQRVTATVLNR